MTFIKRASKVSGLSLTLALLLAGCSSNAPATPDAASGDAARDVAASRTCDSIPSISPGQAQPHADPLRAGPGEVRAGVLRAEQLPPDPFGLSLVRVGDFVLANNRIAVAIEAAGPSDLFEPFGGKILGIYKVRDGALVEPADFNETISLIGRYVLNPSTVGILDNGQSGSAVIRAEGALSPLPFLESVLTTIFSDDYSQLRVAHDWVLKPDREELELRLVVASPHEQTRSLRVLQGFVQSSRMPPYRSGLGFDDRTDVPVSWVGYVSHDSTSYSYTPPAGPFAQLLETTGFTVFDIRDTSIEGCRVSESSFGTFQIGGPGINGLLEAKARVSEASLVTVRGRVVEHDGAPARAITAVHATDPAGVHLTRVTTAADGTFALSVPSLPIRLLGFRRGELLTEPVVVDAPTASAEVRMKPNGTLRVRVTVGSERSPARVQIVARDGSLVPSVPDAFGERLPVLRRVHTEFVTNGEVELLVPVGTYRLLVTRGFEFDAYELDLTVRAGETQTVDASLNRVVDTANTLCADFHVHTSRSPDAGDSAIYKVRAAAADGLDVLVRTDHEFVGDFESAINAAGVSAYVRGIAGEELTTFAWGHFNIFPMVPNDEPNGGAYSWYGKTPSQMFREVRNRSDAPAVIINHPRNTGLLDGFFTVAGYDPVMRTVRNASLWDETFNLVEVFNGSNFEANRLGPVVDWFSFLSAGRRVFAVGGSDSHYIDAADSHAGDGQPVGYPRTCVRVGTDSPRSLDARVFRDATQSGRSFISGGIFLDVRGPRDSRPGDQVDAVGAAARVHVVVEAADWVDVDRVALWVDGQMTEQLPVDVSTRGMGSVRFEGDLTVPVAANPVGGYSYVVVVAEGDDHLDPLYPPFAPFAVSNPIFLRRD